VIFHDPRCSAAFRHVFVGGFRRGRGGGWVRMTAGMPRSTCSWPDVNAARERGVISSGTLTWSPVVTGGRRSSPRRDGEACGGDVEVTTSPGFMRRSFRYAVPYRQRLSHALIGTLPRRVCWAKRCPIGPQSGPGFPGRAPLSPGVPGMVIPMRGHGVVLPGTPVRVPTVAVQGPRDALWRIRHHQVVRGKKTAWRVYPQVIPAPSSACPDSVVRIS
jgi:hypothetical protein